MSYLLPLWGGASETLLRKAQIVVNTAARWVTGLGRRTRIDRLMKIVGWLSVKEQVKLATLVQTWRLVHMSKPQRIKDKLEVTEDFRLRTQGPRLQFSRTCFRWRAVEEWNELQQEHR